MAGLLRRLSALPFRSDDSARETSEVVTLPVAAADDRDLVAGIREQRPAAVAEIFDRYDGAVRRMLRRTLGNAVDVDDLTQETFLTAIARIDTLRDPSALSSFVLGIAVRLAKNELRKRAIRRFVGLEAPSVQQLVSVASSEPENVEGVRRVYRALDTLDSSSRVLFVLRHVEGYELTELAAMLACSLATVKRRLARTERRFDSIVARDPGLTELLGRSSP